MAKELRVVDDKVEMFDRGQRAFHWTNMITSMILLISGLAIYKTGLFGNVTTATWFSWHGFFSIMLIVLVFIHIIYDSVILGRFWDVWFGWKDWKNLGTIIKNFLGATKDYPRFETKFPTLQKVLHWTLAVTFFVLIVTGLILWQPYRLAVFPFWAIGGWDVLTYSRILHQFFTFLFVAVFTGHLYFGILVKVNWPRLNAMFTGYLPLKEYKKKHVSPTTQARGKEVTVSKVEEKVTAEGE